jgi:hypothetical protein
MRSDFLFAQPAFICGIGRLVDLFGLFDTYNQSATNEEADAKGLYSDWRITGEDLLDAALTLKAEAKAANSELQIPLFANQ